MKVRFLSPANSELGEAVEYYDHQLPGLGYRFFQEIESAIERILLFPDGWNKIGKRTRRCMLKNFSYALLYTSEKEEILILAVAHLHREPTHYKERII